MTQTDTQQTGKQHDLEILESLVDRSNLDAIVQMLSDIAYEKAEHIRSNWQDESLARAWERDAKMLDKFAAKLGSA